MNESQIKALCDAASKVARGQGHRPSKWRRSQFGQRWTAYSSCSLCDRNMVLDTKRSLEVLMIAGEVCKGGEGVPF